jgi:hypothetical protein
VDEDGARRYLLGLLKFALWSTRFITDILSELLMFSSASLRPGAVMPWWDMPCPDIFDVYGVRLLFDTKV